MSELRDNVEVVHEESDVNVAAIIRFGIGLLLIAAFIHVFLWWLQGTYSRQNQRAQTQVYPLAAGQQDRLPPSPRFQENPQQELQDLRAKQKALLDGYGWVNKEGGVARIPIENAMKIVVERGLPAREAAK
ncbi:MAG TPA: hypothetical protein VM115_00630 [Vicinamibacterales bacterium]|nr:hypothetical protein [Vicinamibacterales bacterium]